MVFTAVSKSDPLKQLNVKYLSLTSVVTSSSEFTLIFFWSNNFEMSPERHGNEVKLLTIDASEKPIKT